MNLGHAHCGFEHFRRQRSAVLGSVLSRSLRSWAASIQDREVWPCEVERAVEQKVTREAGATTGTARNEKVERGSLEIEQSGRD